MLSITDLKLGTKIIFNNQPHQVIYTEHSKLGRGGSILRTKIKNLINDTVIDKTFAGNEKIEEAELETKKAQFLYKADNQYYFMDSSTFEQFELTNTQIGSSGKFLKENTDVDILYYSAQGRSASGGDDNPINIQLPIKMTLEVTYTEPGYKGNTSSATTKPATLETGAQINVPLFVKDGDKIVVDTRTGEYVERA